MIDLMVDEVHKCLQNNLYLAALTMSLTLPDICGKVAYPTAGNSKRYKDWYQEYIGKYEISEESLNENMPYASSDVVYSLRCSLLHEGNPDIEAKCDIQEFELLKTSSERCSIMVSYREKEEQMIGNQVVNVIRRLSINIRELCEKICACAKAYYDKHKSEFHFNYNLVDIDMHTRSVFHIDKKI